ncbi:MAG: GMC family oxidoreductase [Bryobacteraceae bacterium]|nr:GMC family oxidoreductase [Bryobacteraceae bacterium]
MLSKPWSQRKPRYDFVVVGSGYGGAITAARIANANLPNKQSVCILERGKEWEVGKFPNTPEGYASNLRGDFNPLGLYEVLTYQDISVLKGSGLGGTSLVNANVAIIPEKEVFDLPGWPKALTRDELMPYYRKAAEALNVSKHPRAMELAKVQALDRRAQQIGRRAEPLRLAVNFKTGPNPQGVHQDECTDCGDCITGCNVSAKNTLYMNYLPMAQQGGADIFTQMKVEWIEKTGNGWKVHGRWQKSNLSSQKFELECTNLILSAGAINTTEILLRSANLKGLSVSPALGTRFGGNGDFFGLSFNGDRPTEVLGFGTPPQPPPLENRPGPSIVAVVRHNAGEPLLQRFTVEDLSFASASARFAQLAFQNPLLFPREDTDSGDTAAENARILRDFAGTDKYNGALNHTMLYLCMGFDDARGTFVFERPLFERDGRIRIQWDGVGQQEVFRKINEELKRHTRAEGGSYIHNPLWRIPGVNHLVTAHPLGGCPMADDFIEGAVDEFGRVFKSDGTVHDGLYVADGSLLPSALGVNPFLTISAVSERIADRKIRQLQGEAYPAPKVSVGFAGMDALPAISKTEAELERIFQAAESKDIGMMVNRGGDIEIDTVHKVIRNDHAWKGYFPAGHLLNRMSALIFTGFQKRFELKAAKFSGLTSDTDGRIRARNSLEMLTLTKKTGDLPPGKYVLLKYLDPPWQGFYDIFKVINPDLLIGRVYMGTYPNGTRLFTFPMTRTYAFNHMRVEDHRQIWEKQASVPTKQDLNGMWRMDVISNANQAGAIAYLQFDLKPDGRLESRYQLMGLFEGLVMPSFAASHFTLTDFTGFHDEIRKVNDDLLIGKWVVELPAETANLPPFGSLGIFHQEQVPGESRPRFGYYYLLTRTSQKEFATNSLLRPSLDVQLPAGLGLEFDEEMVGWYFPNQPTPKPGREGDLTIASRIPASGQPENATSCRFKLRMRASDINEFIDSAEHEARAEGTITFGDFDGQGPATFTVDRQKTLFNYLRVNPETGEPEMRYHLEFDDRRGRRVIFEGRKYMQKDEAGGFRGFAEVLEDYTTLYCHVRVTVDGQPREIGTGYLKFRTFEDVAAFSNLTGFLASFRVTGTDDPLMRIRGQMKFLAFTGQFVQREYDPAAATTGVLRDDVRAEVLRGADTPDFFSTRTTEELQAVLREQPTLPLEKLVNTQSVHIDIENGRIFRDCFWKGSFAKDSLPGLIAPQQEVGRIFTGGGYWKRFDGIRDGAAFGQVVNYELKWLPGDPEVREIAYPNDSRRYIRKGDKALLLTYRNPPYQQVYDLIKVIDENNSVGVMHIGDFPNGTEFATFVMSRHNYPLPAMSVDDHRLLMADPRTGEPAPAQIAGDWAGRLILLPTANLSLINQHNPVLFQCTFAADGSANYKLGALATSFTKPAGTLKDLRLIGGHTLIGRWDLPTADAGLLNMVQHCIEPAAGRFAFHFVLSRK